MLRLVPQASGHGNQNETVCMRERGFSLTELLVVIAILGILTGLLLPGLARAKGSAQSTACQNNLKHLQFAWQMYAEDHRGFVVKNVIR